MNSCSTMGTSLSSGAWYSNLIFRPQHSFLIINDRPPLPYSLGSIHSSFQTTSGRHLGPPRQTVYSVQRAWESASVDTLSDVRELIPEMFICHEFLENQANLDIGIQGNGERVDNVKLPPWCATRALGCAFVYSRIADSFYMN
jgi:hypothetical protein